MFGPIGPGFAFYRKLNPNHRKDTGQMRRSGDVLIACALLALAMPLMLITAAAIRLDSPGPVLERRTRIVGERSFEMLSFRTTAQRPGQIRRIWQSTQLGRFLRNTRIDALPRLINVLRGDMSLFETGLFD